jgi:hypothetical protein
MKDDSNKRPIDDEFIQSLCLQEPPKEGDTADDQFTFGRRAILL